MPPKGWRKPEASIPIVVSPQPPFRCPRCDRLGVRATGTAALMCEACKQAWVKP